MENNKKLSKVELVEIIKVNFTNESGTIDISSLDFGDHEGAINLSGIKSKGDLFQGGHENFGCVGQSWHKNKGDIWQHYHQNNGNVLQDRHYSGGNIEEGQHKNKGKLYNGVPKKIKKKYIIDFEFTGIDCELKNDNEISQAKVISINSQSGNCVQYALSNEHTKTVYNSKQLELSEGVKKPLCNLSQLYSDLEIGLTIVEPIFYAWAPSQDLIMLDKYKSSVEELPVIIDIADMCRKIPTLEKAMIINGHTMEAVYHTIFGEQTNCSHDDNSELKAVKKIYNYVVKHEDYKEENLLNFYPFGHLKGMSLKSVCYNHRRSADGYRHNNDNLLSNSLNHWCDIVDNDDDDF